MIYQPRNYRRYTGSEDLVSFRVTVSETDLFISCDNDLSKEAEAYARRLRRDLEDYLTRHPEFEEALTPIAVDEDAPPIIKEMAQSAKKVEVGPMAAVAGAVAEAIARELLRFSSQVIVENGGDIFISSKRPRIVGVYAGHSKFSERMGLRVAAEDTPCGICTSSGTVGHSLSFGRADAVAVLSKSASLADAAATSICNKVQSRDDINPALSYGQTIKGIRGILIIIGDTFGAWGRIKLVDI